MKCKGGGARRLNDTDADSARVGFQMAEKEYACASVARRGRVSIAFFSILLSQRTTLTMIVILLAQIDFIYIYIYN